MYSVLTAIDKTLLPLVKRINPWAGRAALFVVFVWFGVLKVVGASSANAIVAALQEKMLPFVPSGEFIVVLGVFEMMIGVLILIPRWERLSIGLLVIHMATTLLPLIFLPEITWGDVLVPSMEGQYVLKNLVIIAMAIGFAARVAPLARR